MDYEYSLNGTNYMVSINKKDDIYTVNSGEKVKDVKIEFLSENSLLIFDGDKTTRAFYARDRENIFVNLKGNYYELTEAGAESQACGDHADVLTDGIIYPPMPGKVIKVLVNEGDEVKKGEGLLIVESMKMENELSAPTEGNIKKVHVAEGEQVSLDQPLIEIDIPENSS